MKGSVKLFPARAGVIPMYNSNKSDALTFPRTRGGDPILHWPKKRLFDFSPHARG